MKRLTEFLYLLMRDEVVPGIVEKIVRECEKPVGPTHIPVYSNEHLEAYARELAKRLTKK